MEDIKAKTIKGSRKWNKSFSPLEVGKQWFYKMLSHFGTVQLKQGFETAALRAAAGLKKTSKKLSEVFEAHCVDSWVLANWVVGGHNLPDNKEILFVAPVRLHRRQLHMFQFAKGGRRKSYGGTRSCGFKRYGGTRSCGFKRGSLVRHTKWGMVYVGGTSEGRVSLHSIETGKRLTQSAKPQDLDFRSYNIWRTRIPKTKSGVENG